MRKSCCHAGTRVLRDHPRPEISRDKGGLEYTWDDSGASERVVCAQYRGEQGKSSQTF